MTRKDYALIAAAIKPTADDGDVYGGDYQRGQHWAAKGIAERMADALATTNPNFNRDRFLKACGL